MQELNGEDETNDVGSFQICRMVKTVFNNNIITKEKK